jgi:hypothetical protein
MPNLDLTDDEHAAMVRLVKHALKTDRFPLPPRLFPLRATLAKFERSHSASPAHHPRSTHRRSHFNGADIVVQSVDRAQSHAAGVDYRSDVIGTRRVPDDRSQTPPSPQ